MATTSVPNNAITSILAQGVDKLGRPIGHVVWFENFDTANGFWIQPVSPDITQTLDVNAFFLGPCTAATAPTTLVIQSSGGDSTLVRAQWQALQTSGSTLTTLFCGRW